MSTLRIDHPATTPRPSLTPASTTPTSASEFASYLAPDSSAAESPRALAESLVAIVFIQPALASLRESTFAADPFAPGDAERRFGHLLDQHLAERVTHAARFPLVDLVEQHLTRDSTMIGERLDVRR